MPVKHVALETPRGFARGMWHIGEGYQPILIVHGYFGVNRVGPARLYLKIANALTTIGCDVLRLDVVGVGDSDGKFEDITLTSFIDDFLTGANWLIEQMNPNAKPPILIGHSLGANVALKMSDCRTWHGSILIAPEVKLNEGAHVLLDEIQIKEIKENGYTLRKGFLINAEFIENIRCMSIIDQAKSISMPTVIVQGTNDEFYDPCGAKDLSCSLQKAKLIYVKSADHNFRGPKNENALIQSILESVQWINQQYLCRKS